ncbi:MAG: hypothetical protein ACTSQJ_06125, partial [Promethearchaeota archaeon]
MSIILKNVNHTFNTNCRILLKDTQYKFVHFSIIDNRLVYYNDFYFSANKYIEVELINVSTNSALNYNFRFFYTHQTRNNEFSNKNVIESSETQTYYFTDITFLNRLSYTFFNPSVSQDYTIKIYTLLKFGGDNYYAKILEKNIVGASNTVLNGILNFTDTRDIKVELINNIASACRIDFNLFFSKNLKQNNSVPLSVFRLADGVTYGRMRSQPVVVYPANDNDCVATWSGYMPKGWESMLNPVLKIMVSSVDSGDTWNVNIQADATKDGESSNISNLYDGATTISTASALIWDLKTLQLTGNISEGDIISVE